ncbi:MAG: response regulator transcription factor [Anaerotignum sp.]|nr:response regulator transcription factor [Anaerotignum sp.]MBQ7085467.1 response regulator transcription factor [Anaerotignum sp.]
MERILLVEDDKNLSFITKRLLESRGYEVTAAMSLTEAREKLQKIRFDLILLDMMLPDGEGTQLCGEIRETSVCPIIFVSCLSDNMTKISALQMGGDDYVTKPVNYEELIARIQVNIRRAKLYNLKTEADELTFSGLLVKKQKHEVWLTDGNDLPVALVDLSPIEYGLLLCLIDHEGELMLYQTLYHHVWQSEDIGDVRTVMVHVSNLRKKLGDAGKALIHTVRSAGYIFKQ